MADSFLPGYQHTTTILHNSKSYYFELKAKSWLGFGSSPLFLPLDFQHVNWKSISIHDIDKTALSSSRGGLQCKHMSGQCQVTQYRSQVFIKPLHPTEQLRRAKELKHHTDEYHCTKSMKGWQSDKRYQLYQQTLCTHHIPSHDNTWWN